MESKSKSKLLLGIGIAALIGLYIWYRYKNKASAADGVQTFDWSIYAQLLNSRYGPCTGKDMTGAPIYGADYSQSAVATDKNQQSTLTRILAYKSVPLECNDWVIFDPIGPGAFSWNSTTKTWDYISDIGSTGYQGLNWKSDQDLAFIHYQLLDNRDTYGRYQTQPRGPIANWSYHYFKG